MTNNVDYLHKYDADRIWHQRIFLSGWICTRD